MLRQIRFRNFVKFNGSQEHRLDFPKNGVYIFIGENNSGKSCVFEGIRRCLQTELNTSVSTRHNSDNILYFICKFEKTNKEILTSCFVSYNDGNDTVTGKIVLNKSDNGNIITCSIRRQNDGGWGSLKEETLSEETLSDDKNKLYKLCYQLLDVEYKDEIDSNFFIEFCKTQSSDNNYIQKFDQAFKEIKFETIFANRDISPIQSSCQIPSFEGQNIYKDSTTLAYIINHYLNDPEKSTADGSESHYFRCLTEPQSYTFEFKDNTDKTEIFVTCNNDKPFSILKAPEGILESKMMSITLSNKITTTLLIDEPGRGMHPSMIDCLRDLVLYDVNKNKAKTVIFTTHNPRFICPWTIDNIFYFYSCESSGSKVVHLRHEIKDNTKEYLWSDQVSPILFSKRVIMVEGEDDIRFLSTLKNVLLTDEIRRKLVCKIDPEIDHHQLRKFLISLHIIAMNGKGSVKGIEPLCKALNLTQRKMRYYLFDSDALKTIKSSLMKTELNKSDIGDQNVGKLEEHGIFVWFGYTDGIVKKFEKLSVTDLANYGRLEDAILEFCNTHDKIHHDENNRNCAVNDCQGMDTFLKALGKDDDDNRNPNKKKPIELKKIDYLKLRELTERIIDVSMEYGDYCSYRDTNFKCPFNRLFQFLIHNAKESNICN